MMARRPARVGRVEDRQALDPHPGLVESSRRDEPVASVVALPADHSNSLSVAAAGDSDDRAGDRPSRALHLHLDRGPRLDGRAVEACHLLGSYERSHSPPPPARRDRPRRGRSAGCRRLIRR